MIPPKRIITMNLRDARQDPSQRRWDLPAWGHPASLMVMPLFMVTNGHAIPIGTAFTVGAGLGFVMSATHNIMEAIKLDGLHDELISSGSLPRQMSLKNVGLSVLHQVLGDDGITRLSFVPITSIEGAPPTDVVIGFSRLALGMVSLSLPISFAIPLTGDTVWSLGYTDFRYPEGGIPLEKVSDGSFDFEANYGHRFLVVEAQVVAAFSARLSSGFVNGPCFAFDEEIPYGLSGGPVISEDGRLIGVNSAGASMFFDRPMSVATMLYPLARTPISYGGDFGAAKITARRELIELVGAGVIRSDGSEERLAFVTDEDGLMSIMAGVPSGEVTVFEDLNGFHTSTPARKMEGEYYVFRRTTGDETDRASEPQSPNAT
jgi:hypothetical protein